MVRTRHIIQFKLTIYKQPLETIKNLKERLSKAITPLKDPNEIRLSIQTNQIYTTLDDLAVIETLQLEEDVTFSC